MIKVCRVSTFFLRLLQKYHTFSQKVLDKSLTSVYTVYVEWVKGKEMTDKETIEMLALQVEQLSEDVRGLTYTVQDLVAIIGIESVEHDKFGLIRNPSNA